MSLTVLLIDTEENRARALEEKLSESGFERVIRAEGPDLAAAVERACQRYHPLDHRPAWLAGSI